MSFVVARHSVADPDRHGVAGYSRPGASMKVGIFPLMGTLALGAVVAFGADTPQPAAHPGMARIGGSGGIYPVPGMGAPGAVAANGALPLPIGPQMPAPLAPAPLVAAKFLTPAGVRVTAFPGSSISRLSETPTVMGLRPGYVFRFKLSNLPYYPGEELYPEVELRGVLIPRGGMKYMDYPIPLAFSQVDIEQALKGVLITKVIYLEDPEKAIPAATNPDRPVEIPEDTEHAALKSAQENGRLMAIVRLGNRKPSAAELQTVAIDGTILLPDERHLKSPLLPPVFPYWAVPMFDPLIGPRIATEESFENGQDKKDRLGIGADNKLGGLNPTDVGVEYTLSGRRRVTTSNMVTITAPRFITRRVELLPTGYDNRQLIATHTGRESVGWFKDRAALMAEIGRDKTIETIGKIRASAYIGRVGTTFYVGTSKPIAIGQVEGVKVQGALVEPEQLTAYPSLLPLTVSKSVDPAGPKQSGDEVTITIHYANTGAKSVSDLVISDSLSGRLEYVKGSAQTDRPANFSSADNEVGSVLLRWELPGSLLPGQTGTIKFKAKVR